MSDSPLPSRLSSSPVASAEQDAFARALRNRRRERFLSLREAAREMGVAASTVSRWEHGQVDPAVLRAFSWLRKDLELDDYKARAEQAERQLERLRALFANTATPEDHHA